MKRGFLFLLSLFFLPSVLKVKGDPRSQTVEIQCGNIKEHNTTIFVPNFVATMENISDQIRRGNDHGISIVGAGPDANFGMAQCHGDLSSLDCILCYAEARTVLPQCFPYNGGRIFLDGCFMRAENYSFFGEFQGPNDKAICNNKTKETPEFIDTVRKAVSDTVRVASDNKRYARASIPVAGSTNKIVYVLANCWNPLNFNSCKFCLDRALTSVFSCLPSSEARALHTGCFLRYSNTNFLNNESKGKRISRATIIILLVAILSSVSVVAVGVIIGIFLWKNRVTQRKRKAGSNDAEKLACTLYSSSLNFKYSTLEKATGSFDVANKLGHGGYGTVYKGVLADGREVAVKRLFFNNKHRAADFYNEVNIISSVEHKNLVRLLGCSCSGPESLLVYEFLANQSLDRFLFEPRKGPVLNWRQRFEIITGTAEGLAYLHEDNKIRILHRDIKASNILLDLRLRPKIADFGLARTFQDDKSHISTAIAGTLGYMAPEYLAHGQLTEKADVYSYGVLLIEIVTGKQNNRSKDSDYTDSLITKTWKHFQRETLEELFDPSLMLNDYETSHSTKAQIHRVVHIAFLCMQESPTLRPVMSKALQMLLKEEEELPQPMNPPFMDEKTMELNDGYDDSEHQLYPNTFYSNATLSESSFYAR